MQEEEDINHLQNLLYHVLLPRVLPQEKQQNCEYIELSLLSRLTQIVKVSSKWIPCETIRLFESLKRTHTIRTSENISEEINGLQPGATFAMFVRRQNCAFMIHMPTGQNDETKTAIVATFPGNLHPQEIYRHPSDLQFTYPAQALKLEFSEMMRSQEFSQQLCFLYDTLPKETKNRNYVNTWLTTILSDENTVIANFPTITKKMRDEVLGESNKNQSALSPDVSIYKSNYFRRSNFYSATKIFLQLSLTIELGAENGKFLYKIIMLQFMTRICEEFYDFPFQFQLNVDLMTQFMAKIARRIEKLLQTAPEVETKEFYEKSIRKAKSSISMLRRKIDKQIQHLQLHLKQKSQLTPLVDLDFMTDVHQQIWKVREYLEERKCCNPIENLVESSLQIESFNRHKMDQSTLPAISTFDKLTKEIDRNLFLIDFENWILYKMKLDKNTFNCDILRDYYARYASLASGFYAGDQIGISRMLLVRLKLLAIMDRIATDTYPLLMEHRSNIDANIFDILLLPLKIDMQIAYELQMYFNQRNNNAKFPGLIEQSEISSESFAVKFAESNVEMQILRREIQAMGERKIMEKRHDWENMREEVKKLRDRASLLSHEYDTYTLAGGFVVTNHDNRCVLCSLELQINNKKILEYERPLPDCTHEQNAIIFELRIPMEIAALRDVLHLTTEFGKSLSNLEIKCHWTGNSQVSYQRTSKLKSQYVDLGSTRSTSLQCHHVDCFFESLVIKNNWNCVLHASGRSLNPSIAMQVIKSMCTLNIESDSTYVGLQWSLNTTLHTQNQVLARQSECPQNLSISEFKEFGSLRADGHRLQLRKLYAMFATESLSFNQWSVSSLILQTLWETGVSDECGFIRATHNDLQDKRFASALIELLENFVIRQTNNWKHPIKLLTITLFAVRIFEINNDEIIADQLVKLLDKTRAILADWMDKIENAFREMSDRNQLEEQKVRMLLVIVAISGALTFFVSSQHKFFDKIFMKNSFNGFSAPRMWLQSIIILNNNILLGKENQSQTNVRMFIRLIRLTGIHIEDKIRATIEDNPNDEFDVIKRQWTMAANGQCVHIKFTSESPQVIVVCVQIKGIKKYVTIDTITGSFLVDNLPVARLPQSICKSHLFQRIFKQYVFEVQPDASNSYSTVYKYNDCSYEFSCPKNNVIITEHKANGIEIELIPPEILKDEIPEMLIENHSHWWHRNENTIQFRPKEFTDENFSNESGVIYKLDMNTSRLIHLKTRRCMLDINSGSYNRIRDHLARLEREKYIHVLMDDAKIAKVELVRMNLKFKIDCTHETVEGYDVVSNEFNRMRVSLEQNCGTLYGLNHGLFLESIPDVKSSESLPSTKLLILPHSTIHSSRKDTGHVSVDVNLMPELRSPPFYHYQIDEFLRQLKASNSNFSAWFYLAHLHAVTSHGEIEPFTGLSGTERALQILQSSFVWSTAPYSSDALETLLSIADLTPKRSIKENIQSVTWPSTVLNSSAQDTYAFIVNKLIKDSQRLSGLHFHDEKAVTKKISDPTLHIRHYQRCLQLMPNLRVRDSFIPHEVSQTSVPLIPSISYSPNTRLVSTLYHRGAYTVPKSLSLNYFLTSDRTIDGPYSSNIVSNVLNHNVLEGFKDLWISLYVVAQNHQLNEQQLALIWSLYAHEKCKIDAILALQAVAKNSIAFFGINPPTVTKYQTSEGIYQSEVVWQILQNNYTQPDDYNSKSWSIRDRKRHDEQIRSEMNRLFTLVERSWPCDTVRLPTTFSEISIETANSEINAKLLVWNNNRKLNEFIAKIESKLQQLSSTAFINVPALHVIVPQNMDSWSKYQIDFDMKMAEYLDDHKSILNESNKLWELNEKCLNHSATDWWSFYNEIVNSPDKKHLIDAGMYPRMVPSLVLPLIACDKTNPKLKSIIGALASTIAHEQRIHRIESCKNQPQLKPTVDREMENIPHVNWKPCEYPEWLLFEIEQNLTIRRIQIEIAKRMIEPPEIETKHSVMQLNMGEGKTAVIVPILAAVLADGKLACQVTVLKSLFSTNLNALRQYLGGMLNRRIYTFPCRRDMPINECVLQILDIFEECKRTKGVILTLPEYRLSFQLKIYENVQKGDSSIASQFLTAHKWIESNVRNILDESDAILHPKYQLVYTVGNQIPLDGGVNRWTVVMDVLKRVPNHMKRLNDEFGDEKVEFDRQYVENGHVYGAPAVNYRSDVFTPCRIIDSSIYTKIKSLLIEDFVEGRLVVFTEMTNLLKEDVSQLLSAREINPETFERVTNNFTAIERDILLILSGLLRFEVLKLALMKRWRVSYGVNVKGTRKMAVPFKAKDVAAEMTEFGHCDVATCFTQLSYYYSGLTDHQLLQVFGVLETIQNAAEVYEKWIRAVPIELLESSIQSYSGINISDPNQRDRLLFPLLRYNMYVIDFWLSIEVYPREAKTFEKKLICTAWDLCSNHMENRVTGFSGTNDTKNILPLPIAQNDLEELEQTNENVRKMLLRPENQAYDKLPANVSGKMILERLVNKGIPVLLDAGALMLELNNEQMAREWLRQSSLEFDAVVYFDTCDILQTIDRNEIVSEFDCSVYRHNLNRCLVYLDDVHTRGTDLKFPLEWKACVTLSGDIARDKTVQACMRMRQLGKGHSIAFWASHEADIRIRETCNLASNNPITNEHVIEFICGNSQRFEEENTVHWAAAAYNYTKKLAGHKQHGNSTEETEMINLYDKCVDNEFVTLENMYGDKEEAKLTEISKTNFEKLSELYADVLEGNIVEFIGNIDNAVLGKLKIQAPNVTRFRHALDEEQEKELEHELEEERQVERPRPVKPAKPHFNEALKILFSCNTPLEQLKKLKSSGGIVSLSSSLTNTHLFNAYVNEDNPWSKNLFVTQDFMRVIDSSSLGNDDFLRDVWWIGGIHTSYGKDWILLSSFECDRLISTFSESLQSTLFMYRPRLSKFHDNLLHEPRLHVTGMVNRFEVDLRSEVEIGVYAGSMFFKSENEQNSFCAFLGLIPRPRSAELQIAFDKAIIKPNGFVPLENRKYSETIQQCVGECRFNKNAVDLVMKLISAHYQFVQKESHVASIVDRGIKSQINDD